jgi:hypothetical protein
VLVPLFSAVPDSNFNNAFITLASFGWLLLFPSESTYRLVLICTSLASVTALCGPLRGPSHLFDSFSTLCNYFSTVLVCFESIVGKATFLFFFLFIESSTSSFF